MDLTDPRMRIMDPRAIVRLTAEAPLYCWHNLYRFVSASKDEELQEFAAGLKVKLKQIDEGQVSMEGVEEHKEKMRKIAKEARLSSRVSTDPPDTAQARTQTLHPPENK